MGEVLIRGGEGVVEVVCKRVEKEGSGGSVNEEEEGN